MTDHGPPYSQTPVLVQGGRRAALMACLVRGATAAGLGLGAVTVLVMAVWISSPYPDNGPEGALHTAAACWLLAHGTELVRAGTLSGTPAPIGVVPLLLMVLPVWLIHRAARDGLVPDEDGRLPRPAPWGAVCAVSLGYLLVGAVVTLYAAGGPLTADPWSALVRMPLVTGCAAVAGVWTASRRPDGPLPEWLPGRVRVLLARTRVTVALRSAAAGALVLIGGGALLVGSALVWHADAAQDSFLHLAGGWSGRLAVLLLAVALVPNAAVWGAAYGLGPGFALGTGSVATPLAVTGDPALPRFPLLAAVPAEGPGTPLNWACAALPVVAALVIARFTVEAAAPRHGERESAWSMRDTALAAGLGAAGCGVLMALAAAAAGGPMGTGRLVAFGPVWWRTGAVALGWSLLIAVPLAVVVRTWRVLMAAWTGRGMGVGRPGRWPFGGTRGEGGAKAHGEAPDETPSDTLSRAPVPPVGGTMGEGYDFLPERPVRGAAGAGEAQDGPAPSGPGQPRDLDRPRDPDRAEHPERAQDPDRAQDPGSGPAQEPARQPEREARPEPEPQPEPAPLPEPWAAPASPWPRAPAPFGWPAPTGRETTGTPTRTGATGTPASTGAPTSTESTENTESTEHTKNTERAAGPEATAASPGQSPTQPPGDGPERPTP
ncbi:DUF6350 family protein [Streptomyces sp. NPDC001985]|uniref:cell division protein PerM n=1 Tax=Streptomyces sp. NPDC001985 TaxID=3154406 RepID=UPI00332D3B79